MPIEALKEQLISIFGCFVAIFVSVWVVHGAEQAFKPSVLLAMGLVGIVAGLSNLVLPGIKGVPTGADVRSAFTTAKALIYTLGFIAFGLFVMAIGWL
ncbi:hypothetical protein [Devosia salina]|uniref:Uncharacterized protein n=1 Tax=Devosia salina TaxID=2860336 RepID=A0ABX8WEX8_9HYPH|nr:hypothetical protein [Devosia salina]QYO76194.1 hypothetical protein K1X15_16495 [Devosia salina]